MEVPFQSKAQIRIGYPTRVDAASPTGATERGASTGRNNKPVLGPGSSHHTYDCSRFIGPANLISGSCLAAHLDPESRQNATTRQLSLGAGNRGT
jgi:hypothetical protein